jgi:hypothetical protein
MKRVVLLIPIARQTNLYPYVICGRPQSQPTGRDNIDYPEDTIVEYDLFCLCQDQVYYKTSFLKGQINFQKDVLYQEMVALKAFLF